MSLMVAILAAVGAAVLYILAVVICALREVRQPPHTRPPRDDEGEIL